MVQPDIQMGQNVQAITFLLKGGVLPVGRPRSEIPYGDRTWTLGEQASEEKWNIFYNTYILTTRFRATYGNKL